MVVRYYSVRIIEFANSQVPTVTNSTKCSTRHIIGGLSRGRQVQNREVCYAVLNRSPVATISARSDLAGIYGPKDPSSIAVSPKLLVVFTRGPSCRISSKYFPSKEVKEVNFFVKNMSLVPS